MKVELDKKKKINHDLLDAPEGKKVNLGWFTAGSL